MATDLSHIIEFYGETCPHCISMRPVVKQLEKELGGEISKKEVWNDKANQELMMKYGDIITKACGGFAAVPSFVNTKTNQALCGAHEVQNLKLLMQDGDCKNNVCMPHSKLNQGE